MGWVVLGPQRRDVLRLPITVLRIHCATEEEALMPPYIAEGMTMINYLLFVISWGAFVSGVLVWIVYPTERSFLRGAIET